MERFEGKIEIRLCNVGSRSEGKYVFLVMDTSELTVCREDATPYDAPYFRQFDGKRVVVHGRLDHGWLVADEITEMQELPADENLDIL